MHRKSAAHLLVAVAVLAGAGAQGKPLAQPAESKPVEVKVVSLPPASAPAEVKVVSLPATSVPTAVRVVDAPKDVSGEELVKATWVLAFLTGGVFVYTAVLARTTSRVARSQSDDLARRDKDALAREVHRAAHKLRLDAEYTRLLVGERVDRQSRVGAMMGGSQAALQVFQNAKDKESAQLNDIAKTTDDIAGLGVDAFDVLGKLSATELARRQWTLDRDQALIDVIRNKAQKDIAHTEAERVRHLTEGAMYRAAKMGNPSTGAQGQQGPR